MTRRRQSGLTFVELLMAVMVFSILAAGLSMHLLQAMRVWQTTTAAIDAMQQRRLTREWLARDLANLVAIEPRADGMPRTQFGPDVMRFYTVPLAQEAAPAPPAVWCVTYQLVETPEGYALSRGAQTLQDACLPRRLSGRRQAGLADAAVSERLLSNLEHVSLRYGALQADGASQIAWSQHWEAMNELPLFVEVVLGSQRVAGTPWRAGRPSKESGQLRWVFRVPNGGPIADTAS